MKKNRYKILAFLCFLSVTISGQTSNYGEFVVAENTVFSNEQAFVNTTDAVFINDGDTFFYGNIVNDGMIDFTKNSNGGTYFSGTSLQDISGTETSYFNNLTVNNTSNNAASILVNNNIFLTNETNFIEGIVHVNDTKGSVIFENNATAINVSNTSFVDGEVTKEGVTSFNFPIGDKENYRPAAISAPTNALAVFNGQYFYEDPDTKYARASIRGGIELVNANEYWVIENTSGTTEEVLVSLTWDIFTTPEAILEAPKSALHVLHWNEAGAFWEDEGGVVDEFNNTVTTLSTVSNSGVYTLGRVSNKYVLPTGEPIYNMITANGDARNDYFRIQDLEKYKNNEVLVFDRWGAKVFGTTNYDTNDNVFRGFNKGKSLITNSNYLPTGNYFYIITYDNAKDGISSRMKETGFIQLNSD